MKITEAILKVKKQRKTEKGTVIMDCMLSSKKKDGSYYNPIKHLFCPINWIVKKS